MAAREIKFQDQCGDLVGCQNGMMFIIRTGVIAGTPSHWVTVVPGGGAPNFSTMGHQYFHLDEAKEFCRQIAAGEIDLADLRAQYDAEDEGRILDTDGDLAERVVLFRARLAAAGLSFQELEELEALHSALGEMGHQVLLYLEREEKMPQRSGGSAYAPHWASRPARERNSVPQYRRKMVYVVQWCDHEGSLRELRFKNRRAASAEAEFLRKNFDGVRVYEEQEKHPSPR